MSILKFRNPCWYRSSSRAVRNPPLWRHTPSTKNARPGLIVRLYLMWSARYSLRTPFHLRLRSGYIPTVVWIILSLLSDYASGQARLTLFRSTNHPSLLPPELRLDQQGTTCERLLRPGTSPSTCGRVSNHLALPPSSKFSRLAQHE